MGNTSPYGALRTALNGRSRSKKTRQVKNGEFKFFNQLPAVLKGAISAPLAAKDAANLSYSSKEMNVLLQHPPAVSMRLRKFLHHVVHGEYAAMQAMLRANINLLCHRGIVTDCSGRNFDVISGFEYALWALDKFQWEDMLACLPRDNTGHLTEEGQKTVIQLQQQYVHVKTNGVRYRLNGVSKTESHYDFGLIKALQEQFDAQTTPGLKNWTDIHKHWRTIVGGAQRLCPMHVVDEYCSDTPFDPLPQFNARPRLARDRPHYLSFRESWFGVQSKLGVYFARYKAGLSEAAFASTRASGAAACIDLDAMTALCKTRTLDFSALQTQLESMMGVEEEHPRPSF